MLDLSRYSCLGEALREALERWPHELCAIEADRDRENRRLTYRQFKEAALLLGRGWQEASLANGTRVAIIMTNQSKWLISAYAIFYCGGAVVPLDYKLTPTEQLHLLAHSGAEILVTEYHFWRAMTQAPEFDARCVRIIYVTEAPQNSELFGARRWEDCRGTGDPEFVMCRRSDPASIVYSSGTGGRPKGCVLTHGNYLEQLTALADFFPFQPGHRYLSILPTNHAIDFVVGFLRSFLSGACVVHLRTLRPEYVREAFVRYQITHAALVPQILKNLERGLRDRLDALSPSKRFALRQLIGINRRLTRKRPNVRLGRKLFPQIHSAFGGKLEAMLTGGAFMEPPTLEFFYDLGIPITNGYGLTETVVSLTLNDLNPFRSDTVGRPVPGVELRILDPDESGIGEVAVRSKTIMSHYLDDPELTDEVMRDGWFSTGDLGRVDASGHLQLFGRKKNMIVTPEGKNIYPEDIENVFNGVAAKEYSVFAANYLWPARTLVGEQLILVVHREDGNNFDDTLRADIDARNRKLLNYKRVSGVVMWDSDFPRTAAMKIKRNVLAEQIREALDRSSVVAL